MGSDEAAKIIKDLREQVAFMKEVVANIPPTLDQALEWHAKWLRKEEGGVQLDLSGRDLSGVNLSGAILTGTDLRHTNLTDARLDAKLARALVTDTIKSRHTDRGGPKPGGRG